LFFMPWVKQLEVPHRLRAMVRARESSIIVLALLVGALAGLVIAAMGALVALMHVIFFGLDPGERLSAQVSLNPLYAFFTPCIGGLLFGLATAYVTRRRGTEVDPIEANALHGGRMSMRGSLIVAAQTVWSSGIGASVGLEAGYTQLASGTLRRSAAPFACAAMTCACWLAAARLAPLPAPSELRSAAPSMGSS
jgi:CIC family chloride channel protein